MIDPSRNRLLAVALVVGVAVATLSLTAGQAGAAEPTVTLTESCGYSAYGVTMRLSGFPPDTPFSASLSWNSGSVGSTFTTDAGGAWSYEWGSSTPMGLVTFTVQALGQTFVATLQSPCESGSPRHVPPAEPQGCHGRFTVQYKQLFGDAGLQGSAIGGRGNSDGDTTNGQAHGAVSRGFTLQAFLADNCQVGSRA